ncbi:MAG: response regulator [Gammaproteobacteria bacterium]|nr:MAG: response regulator [Gammaproteobacteria bacterium]
MKYLLHIGIALLMAGIFLIDRHTPLGIAIGVLYVVPVLLSLGARNERFCLGITLACTLLIFFGMYKIAPETVETWSIAANRALSCLVVWVTAILGLLRLRGEQALRRARDAAEAATRSKAQFLAHMSHELRTPLTAIIGYSEMLEEDAEHYGHPTIRSDLRRIHTAGRHLMDLIGDILDLSRIEAGKLTLTPRTFTLGELLEPIRTTLLPLASVHHNTLTIQAPEHEIVHADPLRLRQCLMNLLSNAAKFTERGEITLKVERRLAATGMDFIFTVGDTGIGMSPETLDKVFDAFVQAADGPSAGHGGAGLGLTITRELAQLMGGGLRVESAPGKGSFFTLWLPQPQRKLLPIEPTKEQATAGDGNLPLVLVIDDETESRELLSRTFAGKGYRTVTAASGEEGLRLARSLRPAAITLDVLMPELSGWDTLAALKADPEVCAIPVIMVTIVDEANHGFALGASDYLVKPIDRDRLLELLEHYCLKAECTALVVEDDPITRELLARTLEKAGWWVREAVNGRQALAVLAEERPDVILLDLVMPEMDGFEFVEALQRDESRRDIPVVLLTAKDLNAEDHRRLNGLVTSIIEKTHYRGEDLLGAVLRQLRAQIPPASR